MQFISLYLERSSSLQNSLKAVRPNLDTTDSNTDEGGTSTTDFKQSYTQLNDVHGASHRVQETTSIRKKTTPKVNYSRVLALLTPHDILSLDETCILTPSQEKTQRGRRIDYRLACVTHTHITLRMFARLHSLRCEIFVLSSYTLDYGIIECTTSSGTGLRRVEWRRLYL